MWFSNRQVMLRFLPIRDKQLGTRMQKGCWHKRMGGPLKQKEGHVAKRKRGRKDKKGSAWEGRTGRISFWVF